MHTDPFRLAAQWYRFLESVSSPRRKLAQLDRLIWQFRNLYPGLTPALAWAIWDVAQALLSIGVRSPIPYPEDPYGCDLRSYSVVKAVRYQQFAQYIMGLYAFPPD